jgi:hypothetical protein
MTVNYDMITKRITIDLDGQTTISKLYYSPFAMKSHFDLETSETHKVEVSAGWFSPNKVLVDGKPVQQML